MKSGSEPVSEKAVVVEEKTLAAEISAEHAAKAVKQAGKDELAVEQAVAKNMPACPHCGVLLKPHKDEEGHMHCYSVKCGGESSACCFEPHETGPRLRAGAPTCPALA